MHDHIPPAKLMRQVQDRLLHLVEHRPYVFLKTRRDIAEQYLAQERGGVGLSEQEIANVEQELGVSFPSVFRAFLVAMGKNHGQLFRGSDTSPDDYLEYRQVAEEQLMQSGAPSLTARTVVFLLHQGYSFYFFEADGSYDPPIYLYVEGNTKPQKLAATFAELVENELRQMEDLTMRQRQTGGHYVTVGTTGRVSSRYPALSSNERPLDRGDQFE
jgi:hypothetical protein